MKTLPKLKPEKKSRKRSDSVAKASPRETVRVALPVHQQIGDPAFLGFIPDWADFHMVYERAFNPLNEINPRPFLVEHFLLMTFRRRVSIVPQEFVRQFYFNNPIGKNWRSRLLAKAASNWKQLDHPGLRKRFTDCMFCLSGGRRHTHMRIVCRYPPKLQHFFVIQRNGELVCHDQWKREAGDDYSLRDHPPHKSAESFLHFGGPNSEKYKGLIARRVIRKAYWPMLLLGWQAGLCKFAIRALLGVTGELTRADGKQLVISNIDVPTIRNQKGRCPVLEANLDYVIFGGNRRKAIGQGYQLFGRTNQGWVKRLGLEQAYKSDRKAWRMYVARFVFRVLFSKLIPDQLGLTVAAYHAGKNEWKGLADLRRATRSESGLTWIEQATIRIYAPANWSFLWRSYLSQQLGYSWIPENSSQLASSLNNNFITPKETLAFLEKSELTREQFANELTRFAGETISTKKIQRYIAGTTSTPEFQKLLTDYVRSS